MPPEPFSKRNNFQNPKEITIREEAPANLRYFVLQLMYDRKWRDLSLLTVLCKLLRAIPESNEEYEYQVRKELQQRLYGCDWYQFYDFIEALYSKLAERDGDSWEPGCSRICRRGECVFHWRGHRVATRRWPYHDAGA
jgi:AbiJ N-terminal domain 4